ncbi:hypothetical protein O3M35_009890 [Rhynocoris fuscipes]|uniref:Nucleolar pre-ribosomal-associated protein 1 n=1 Tax=Rhynocoris fuscipes TaxID=488301 RepID=A0AAW1DC68_9HEMI
MSSTKKRKVCDIENEDDEEIQEEVESAEKEMESNEEDSAVDDSDEQENVDEEESEKESGDDDDDDENNDEEKIVKDSERTSGDDEGSNEEDLEAEEYQDGGEMDNEALPSTSTSMTATVLRQKLGTEDGPSALKQYFSQKDDLEHIGEYLKEGGSISELVAQLDLVDIRKGSAVDILSAMSLVILKSLKEFPDRESELIEDCKEFITKYIVHLTPMLTQKISLNRKKIVLKLLTAIASINDALALQILSALDLKKEVIYYLAEHNNPLDESSIRILYIQFLLSFIVGHNARVVNRICDKRYWIPALFPEMKYDLFKTVDLVLTALQEWLLFRKEVTKNSRLYVFNSKSLSHLATLYEWNPKSWRENVKDKKVVIPNTDPWELSQIRAKVHQLLLNLCTSAKVGVIFHDLKYGTSQLNANNLVQQFLLGFSQPWEDDLKSELVSKTLISCPDLMKPYCNSINSILKLPISVKWVKCMKFITKIIEDIKVEPTFLENKSWLKIIYNVYAPEVILEAVRKDALLQPGSLELRVVCLSVISVIVKKLNIIYSFIKKPLMKNVFTNNLSQLFMKVAPNAEILLGCLKLCFKEDSKECIKLLLDLIFSMHVILPQLFDIMRYNKDCIKMIEEAKDSYKTCELDKDNCLMILKLIKLELLLNPQADIKDNMTLLEDLFTLSQDKDDDCKKLSLELIEIILENTGLFLNTEFELKLWLHLLADNLTKDIGSLFTRALISASDERFDICNAILSAQEDASEEIEAGQINLDDFINLSINEENEKSADITANMTNENPYNNRLDLSPLLPALLKTVSQASDKKLAYDLLAKFMIHYLHTQVSVKAYSSLLMKYTCYAVEKVQQYISAWNTKPKLLKLAPFSETVYANISKYILLKSDEKPHEMIDLNDSVMVELCLNQCIFMICQMSLLGQALEENITRVTDIVKYLMSVSSKLPLTHPQLINDFHPIRILDNPSNLTSLVISIVENSSIPVSENVISPYTNRLFFELKYAKKNKYRLENISNLQQLLVNFPLSKERIIKLIEIAFSIKPKYFYLNKELTPWINILEYLLRKASELNILISENSLAKLCQIFYELNTANFNLLQLSKDFYLYLVKCNVEVDGSIFENFKELFNCLCIGNNWYEELTVYLMKLLEQELSELPADIPFERAVILISSVDGENKKNHKHYERILSAHYSDMLIALYADPSPAWLLNLRKIVKTVMVNKIADKLCKDINKLYDQVIISNNTLLLMKEIFDKSEQNNLFLFLLNQWIIENIQNSEHIKCEELCKTFLEVAKSIETTLELPKVDSNVTKYLILYGMKQPSCPMLDQLAFYVKTNNIQSPPNLLLELIWSHTKFISLFVENSEVKISLLALILKLFQMDKSLIKDSYVPLFLSAYHASLSDSDQIILEILNLFETYGVNMSKFQPYLWGESATEHYAIKKSLNPAKVHPSITLDHLNMDTIKNTIKHFPINRMLQCRCKVEFESVYDPAFILSVLNQILLPENNFKINPWKLFHCGAAAIAFASLSSNSSEIRAAACLLIQKIHSAFNGKKDAMVWYHFIESVRQGLGEFNKKDQVPKISSIVSTFLARASLIIGDPTHFLYKQINNFIHARLVMNLNTIPALLEIFHSTEEDYRLHQQWILEVLRDGMREPADLQLTLNCVAFKFLLDFHSSCLANKEIKILIEELVAKCLQQADKERNFLINNYSLLPWLESSGKSKIIIEQLPRKLVSQYKSLVNYVCREVRKTDLEDEMLSRNHELYKIETIVR